VKNFIVLTGLSCSGKSTLMYYLINNYGMDFISCDAINFQVAQLLRIKNIGSNEQNKWREVNKVLNVPQAKYWFYTLAIQRMETDNIVIDGYSLLYKDDRVSFEAALNNIFPHSKIHHWTSYL
jgi:predicted kinase